MKKLKILLRFDDICPTMNWEQWDRAKQLMNEKGVTALLGVIPDCQDPDLNIEWPLEGISVIQSDKDSKLQSFKEYCASEQRENRYV